MTEDAPWMGTVPEPPQTPACNGLLSCTSDLHTDRCAHVAVVIRRRDLRQACSVFGHEWEFKTTAAGDLKRVICPRCNKSYGVVET